MVFEYIKKMYLNEVVAKFGMETSKPYATPVSPNNRIDIDEKGSSVDQRLYRCIMGSLLCVAASRPDIMYSVFLC